jgi:hypothetical protein
MTFLCSSGRTCTLLDCRPRVALTSLRRSGRRAFADRVQLDPPREGTAESVTGLSIMGTRKDKFIRVPHSVAVVMAAAEQACLTMGARLASRSPQEGRLSARMGMSIWSWGEQLNIAVEADSSTGSIVRISSEVRGQLIDWGKNLSNLEGFELALMANLAGHPDPGLRGPLPDAAATPPIRRVFVSYRRGDSTTVVGRIYDRLCATWAQRTSSRTWTIFRSASTSSSTWTGRCKSAPCSWPSSVRAGCRRASRVLGGSKS